MLQNIYFYWLSLNTKVWILNTTLFSDNNEKEIQNLILIFFIVFYNWFLKNEQADQLYTHKWNICLTSLNFFVSPFLIFFFCLFFIILYYYLLIVLITFFPSFFSLMVCLEERKKIQITNIFLLDWRKNKRKKTLENNFFFIFLVLCLQLKFHNFIFIIPNRP